MHRVKKLVNELTFLILLLIILYNAGMAYTGFYQRVIAPPSSDVLVVLGTRG